MLKLAICEDDELATTLCRSYIERFSKETETECAVSAFSDAVQFLDTFRAGMFDLIFMDIQMPVLSGVEAAKRVRRVDSAVSIVFVTDLKNRMADGYAVEAMDFIVKPMRYLKFSVIMKRALKRLSHQRAEIFLQTGTDAFRVPVDSIFYVEVDRNRCFYHTEADTIEIWSSLKKEEERLKGYPFIKANSCYLVNLSHIRGISGDMVLIGSTQLAISRSKRKELMEAFTAYVAENHL